MPWLLLLALLISILALIFAIQNTAAVTVSFLVWETQSPLTIVLLIALAIGAVVTALAMLPSQIRGKWSNYSKGRQITDIETELMRSQAELQETQLRVDELKRERDRAIADQQSEPTKGEDNPKKP